MVTSGASALRRDDNLLTSGGRDRAPGRLASVRKGRSHGIGPGGLSHSRQSRTGLDSGEIGASSRSVRERDRQVRLEYKQTASNWLGK